MILDRFKLDGKKAIITGGTKGIGKAITLGLAQAGADAGLVSRKDNPELRTELEAMGRKCWFHAADLSRREQSKSIIPSLSEEMGGLDILVNCAGMITRQPVEDFTEADWDATLETNLSSVMLLCQGAAKIMLAQGTGKIINVASILSFQGGLNVPAYASSKHAMVGLTRSCANAWAGRGLNVNAIAPGFFATELTQALQDDPVRSASLMTRVPAGRWGNPDDIQGAAVYLASAASDFVNGTTIAVDGGWLAN